MQVSFIIPLYNCLPLTQAMLESLRATLPGDLPHEIIFVDDGSTDGTRDWLRTLPPDLFRVVLNERNLGYAAANNRAAAIARGEFLALLNNDLILTPRWFEPLIDAHAFLGATRTGLIGNVQRDAKTGAIDHAGIVINVQGKPVHLRELPRRDARLTAALWTPPAVTGACVLVQRSLWQQLGGFDEAFMNGGEDIDLCFRARIAGRTNAVALNSIVRHHVSSSPGRKLRDEQNSHRLAQKWRGDFVAAADHGTRTWCRDYLARALAVPHSAEYRLALAALSYLSRARRQPPPEAVAAVERNLAQEFARWDHLLATTRRRSSSPTAPAARL